MTAEEIKLCRDLMITPPRGVARISKEQFLRQFPSSVEKGRLALNLLENAFRDHNAEDLQCALVIGFVFGFAPEHTDILCRLVGADWHHSHEDVISALDELRTPDAAEALYQATQLVPSYLEYDENRAMAVKAIWALGNIGTPKALEKLREIAFSNDPILRQNAADQLSRLQRTT